MLYLWQKRGKPEMTGKTGPQRRIKRINVELDEREANEFKARLVFENIGMAAKIREWIRDYMKDYRQGRRKGD